MKKIIVTLLVFPLLAFQCDDQEPCGEYIEFQKNKLITVDHNSINYEVNDTLWINATVDRNISNSAANFDLFTDNTKLAYYLNFEKQTSFNQFVTLQLNDSYVITEKGSFLGNSIILLKENDFYKSRIGIKLLETGTFNLKIYNVSSYDDDGFNCNKRIFSLFTTFSNDNTNIYSFSVQ